MYEVRPDRTRARRYAVPRVPVIIEDANVTAERWQVAGRWLLRTHARTHAQRTRM